MNNVTVVCSSGVTVLHDNYIGYDVWTRMTALQNADPMLHLPSSDGYIYIVVFVNGVSFLYNIVIMLVINILDRAV